MQLNKAIQSLFIQIIDSLDQLTIEQYKQPSKILSGSTIGQHVRHVIELFICLENGYNNGLVNYEKRKRDTAIETNKDLAISLFDSIYTGLEKENKNMILESCVDEHSSESIQLSTNYHREVAYNLEHTIHHMALIRVGINEVSNIILTDNFGVASSTIKYREACAQ